jgi:hypothetical protein
MNAYQNSDRFHANMEALARADDALVRDLRATAPSSRLVTHDGGLNVDLGDGSLLYPQGVEAATARQVDEFLKSPLRYIINIGSVLANCVEINKTYAEMRNSVSAFPKATEFGPFGGFLIIFGLGLGLHVERLAQAIRFKTLIIIEPHDEIILHSCHTVDWAGLLRRLEQNGQRAHFIRGDQIFEKLTCLVRGNDYPLLSGSTLFFHVETPDFAAIRARILSPTSTDWTMITGWVEDQLLLLRNNAANFARPGFHLLKSRAVTPRSLPAFVVGAGPSLDFDIEEIRARRDQVVLISASSSLKVLLEHGLTPDIHCELENSEVLGDVDQGLAAKYDLSQVTLFASPTLSPRIAPCFKRAVYFFRSQLSSTGLYGHDAISSRNGDPTSGNAAIYCALSLGFRQIYLFGLDFGARDPDHHHSRHSVYYTYEDESELATYRPYDFNVMVPANFGGQVSTGWVLDWARTEAANAIRNGGNARVFNCSDGALIPGTVPMVSEVIDLPAAAMEGAQDVERALAELTFCPNDLSEPEEFARLGSVLRGFLDGCLDHIAHLDRTQPDFQTAIAGLCETIGRDLERLERGDDASRAARFTLLGNTHEALVAAFHAASTLDPAVGEAGLAAILQTLAEAFQRLYPLVDSVFRHTPQDLLRHHG